MFDISSARGRLALAIVLAASLSVGACVPNDDEGETTMGGTVAEDGGAEEGGAEEDDDAGGDGGDGTEDTDGTAEEAAEGETTDGDADGAPAAFAAASGSADYGSCHDFNEAGGASDGVLYIPLGDGGAAVFEGRSIELDVEKGDGSTVTSAGRLVDDAAVFLIPLSSFGEEITITGIAVDGTPVTDDPLIGEAFVVDPESDCEHHPSAG